MKRWFRAQPIHRKLVLTSMVKTAVVLFIAMLTLFIVDTLRFRRTGLVDAASLAVMVGENVREALLLNDRSRATPTLGPLTMSREVARTCVYSADGRLFAQYVKSESIICPGFLPGRRRWLQIEATVPVTQAGETVGYVFVGRDWAVLRSRMVTAGVTSLIVLVLASALMLVVSHFLHRTISEPIRRLARAASEMGKTDDYRMPAIPTGPDELGQLVGSFGSMVDRVRSVTQDLRQTNEALRREIEERRLVEREREALLSREQEANRVKDEFLATVSHELRTPLNAIVGWAQILATSSPDSATVAKAAASLHRNAQAQARVIDDLIDISRIVTGKLSVSAEPLDLREVVESAAEAIRPTARHAGVTLTVRLPATACVMAGDRDRLQQVVWNLLSNAVKFAPQGRVLVTVVQEDFRLKLQVSDTGIGIAPGFIGQVFDRFRQADSSVTREQGGLGIGLAVVKELVELHGGSIAAASPGKGGGAVFTVEFPCIPDELLGRAPVERAPSLDGVSVLAVDDNLDSLEVLQAVLEEVGASVRTASSGADALDRWHEDPPDVLLCDLAMPAMSGFEVLARVREYDRQQGRLTPVIAVTAHATDEQVARSARAGFQAHVAKPFNRLQLVRAIAAARTRV